MKASNSAEVAAGPDSSVNPSAGLSRKKTFGIILGLLISVGAGYLAIRDVAWAEFSESSRSINWAFVGLGVAGLVVADFMRSVRWLALLRTDERLPLMLLFQVVMVGLVLNLLIPLRFGDIFRAMVLRRYLGISYGVAGASLVGERLFDVITLAIVFAIAAIGVSLPGYLLPVLGIVAAVAVVGAAAIFVVALYQDRVLGLISRVSKARRPLLQRLAGFVSDFVVGLSPIKNSRAMAEAWGYSFLIRIAEIVAIGFVLLSLDIDIGVRGFALVNSLTMLGLAIPSGPGAVGSFELLARIGIETFAVAPSIALFGAVLIHAVHIVATIVVGGVATVLMIRRIRGMGITLGTLASEQQGQSELRDDRKGRG